MLSHSGEHNTLLAFGKFTDFFLETSSISIIFIFSLFIKY